MRTDHDSQTFSCNPPVEFSHFLALTSIIQGVF